MNRSPCTPIWLTHKNKKNSAQKIIMFAQKKKVLPNKFDLLTWKDQFFRLKEKCLILSRNNFLYFSKKLLFRLFFCLKN